MLIEKEVVAQQARPGSALSSPAKAAMGAAASLKASHHDERSRPRAAPRNLAAHRRAETEVLLPAGPKIAFTGGADFTDHRLIWDMLDKVATKHPGMVLMHGGSPKGAELIASRWADSRKVAQIAFKPDWTRHAKAAPFKRNDAMLDILPIGVIVFAGTGIQDNLADKARKLDIPLFDFRPKPGG